MRMYELTNDSGRTAFWVKAWGQAYNRRFEEMNESKHVLTSISERFLRCGERLKRAERRFLATVVRTD